MAHRDPLTIELHPATAGATRVRVSGDLDSASAPDLRATLDEHRANGSHVVLDLADLRFVDSTGLRVLVDAARARADGWNVEVIDELPAHLGRIMGITGTLAMFQLVRRG